jgi:bacterioferritin-associated ferredoxin
MNKDHVILCRCEDISLEQVQDYINQGYSTFEDLKRLLRVGMGPCQASTCGHLIQKEISRMLNLPIEDVAIHKVRPLILGVPLNAIAGETDETR